VKPLAAHAQRLLLLLAAVLLIGSAAPARALQDAVPTPAKSDSTAAPAPAMTGKPSGKKPRAAKQARAPREKKPKQAKVPKAPPPPRVKKSSAASDSVAAAKLAQRAKKAKEPAKPYEERRKEDGIYAQGANWLSLRFGYAKRTGDVTGEGLVGYGMAYQHMITRRVAFEAGAAHDIVGHFNGELDEVVPFTGEFQRHFHWNTAVRPYLGLGGGFYLHKSYRTGTDYTTTTSGGPHLSIGFSSQLDPDHVIGLVVRVATIQGRTGVVNPTFGPEKANETIWTAKISWGLAY
jgi:hypothetical protein